MSKYVSGIFAGELNAGLRDIDARLTALEGAGASVKEPATVEVDLWDVAHRWWKKLNAKHSGAVQWARGSGGELLVFTRGEYAEKILDAVKAITATRFRECYILPALDRVTEEWDEQYRTLAFSEDRAERFKEERDAARAASEHFRSSMYALEETATNRLLEIQRLQAQLAAQANAAHREPPKVVGACVFRYGERFVPVWSDRNDTQKARDTYAKENAKEFGGTAYRLVLGEEITP